MNDKKEELEASLEEHKEEEEERLVEYLSQRYNLKSVKSSEIQIAPDALQTIKEEESRAGKLAIFKRNRKKLSIAILEVNRPELKETLTQLERRGFSCELFLASNKTLNSFWDYYKDIISTSAASPGELAITNEELEETLKSINSIEDGKKVLESLKTLNKARKISKNVEYIVATAIALNSSDIHIEPSKDGGLIRYRIDGVLLDMSTVTKEEYKQLLTRLKIVSKMKITQKGAQDGGFVIELSDRSLSARSSVIPEDKGGSFVIRLLDPKNVIHEIEKLGLHPSILELFRKEIKKPNGMIITTGPTGSGKTTTLYSFLSLVKNSTIKIITLEDPIEYRLEGIVQTQITPKYSFASGLRSIVRQDPDVILVGEIRDKEVADVAINAALTGHLVFSTLHTNDVLGTLPRLIQLGVDQKTLSQALNIIIAQRLLRVLCPHCSIKAELTDKQKQEIEERISGFPSLYQNEKYDLNNIKQASETGCPKCHLGYKGRIGAFEVLKNSEKIENLILNEDTTRSEFKKAMIEAGYPFIDQDGLWKVLKGKTSLEELNRVLGLSI